MHFPKFASIVSLLLVTALVSVPLSVDASGGEKESFVSYTLTDGEEVKVPTSVAKLSMTYINMAEALGGEIEETIPLHNVVKQTWNDYVGLCTLLLDKHGEGEGDGRTLGGIDIKVLHPPSLSDTKKKEEEEKKSGPVDPEAQRKKEEEEKEIATKAVGTGDQWLNAQKLGDQKGRLVDLLLFANYLDTQIVLQLVGKFIAGLIKGKTAEQLAEEWAIPKDKSSPPAKSSSPSVPTKRSPRDKRLRTSNGPRKQNK